MDRKPINIKDSAIQHMNIVGHDQINNFNSSPLTPRALGDWLSFLNFNLTQANVWEQRTDGTGTWFLESHEFKAWLMSAAQETLWCIGIPGSGKTVLSSIAIEYLQQYFQGNDVATTFIYCNHKEQATHTVRELIASILKQLVQDHPVISEWASSLYDKHHSKATYPLLLELMEVLRMEVGRYSRVFVIVDALDELDEHHRVRLIKSIQSLSNTVNLMVTSRPLPPIEAISQGAKSMQISASAHNVRAYIQHCIQQEPRLMLFAGERGELQESIVDKISGNVQGMFVYSFYDGSLFVCI